jgi:hypothetical protein
MSRARLSGVQKQARLPGHRRGGRLRALTALVSLALALAASPVGAQSTATLGGQVVDELGVPVQNVAITIAGPVAGTLRTVLTDAEGAYRFVALPAGRYRVRADLLGYRGEERELVLGVGENRRVDLSVRTEGVPLEEVVVDARRARERVRFETEAGITARVVDGRTLKLLPGLAEADVLRAVELLPGVVSTSDFTSAFHVRGGSADQNLFLLDGFPIFNPFHLGGIFGVFNADAVARAELLAGGFGAEYGGRVSSVLNVESLPAEGPGWEVQGGVSLLASRLLVRSSLPARLARSLGGSGGSWFVSARRSYFDQILKPVVDFPYHLTDLQGFATLDTRGGGRLSFTGYGGQDVLDLADFRSEDDASSILRVRWYWGNRVLGARWEQPVGRGWVLDSRLGRTSFAENLGFVDFDDVRFDSRIEQLLGRIDLRGELGLTTSVQLGAALDRISYENRTEGGGTSFFGAADSGWLAGGYASFRWRPSDRWLIEPGARLDAWMAADTSHQLVSPRFSAKRFLGPGRDAAVKLSFGRYTQFLHSLRNEELPISNDAWVLAGRFVPPVRSDQVQLGYERFWADDWSISLEAYLRTFRGVTEFNLADDPNDPADDLLAGRGRSHGADLLLRRNTGRLTGWLALSYLRATRTLPDPLAPGWEEFPPAVTFPPIYDRRFDLDVVAEYTLGGRVELGARWNFGSPLPYTRPVGQYLGWRYEPGGGYFEPNLGPWDRVPLYVVLGRRNEQRYPSYHRLDLTARRTFNPRWGTVTPYLQVLNAYNRRNVLFYFYNYDRVPPTRSGLSMFPVLPALGVDFSF